MRINRNSMILIEGEESNTGCNFWADTWQSAKGLNYLWKFPVTQ